MAVPGLRETLSCTWVVGFNGGVVGSFAISQRPFVRSVYSDRKFQLVFRDCRVPDHRSAALADATSSSSAAVAAVVAA